jgi:SAM-dependent methyltransferase
VTTAAEERTYWDYAADDPANVGGGPGSPTVEHMLDMIDPVPADHMLDLGSGPGRIAVPVADANPDSIVWCVDVSARMLIRTPARGNIKKAQGDGRTIPLDVPQVGFGWSVLMFQHVRPHVFARYMEHVAARLTPGGVFVAQWVTNADEHDYSRPVSKSLGALFGVGAGLELVESWTDPLVEQWQWARWVKP